MPHEVHERAEIQALIGRGVQVVEVLGPEEFEEDHLPGAINLPLRKLETEAGRVLDRSRPVLARAPRSWPPTHLALAPRPWSHSRSFPMTCGRSIPATSPWRRCSSSVAPARRAGPRLRATGLSDCLPHSSATDRG